MTGTAYAGVLDFEVSGRRWRRRQRPPLSLTVLDRSERGLLVMPADGSGGSRGGDSLSVRVAVRESGDVEWRPPASALFYPGLERDRECRIDQVIEVSSGSSLRWIPKVSIPCSDARIVQKTVFKLWDGANVEFWDGWADGRTASGERSLFGSLNNRLELWWNDRLVYQERWTLEGRSALVDRGPAGFRDACQWFWGLACGTEAVQRMQSQVALWQSQGASAECGLLCDGVWLARALTDRPYADGFSEPTRERFDLGPG